MTPLLKLKTPEHSADVWAKLENLNPSGSSKERICSAIITEAESRGVLRPGKTTLVEATSGNTGIALAFLCAAKNYRAALFMPEGTGAEKKAVAKAYGAEIFEPPGGKTMTEVIRTAREFVRKMPDKRFFIDQFSNLLNPQTHRLETAREILSQMELAGKAEINAFVMGVGTGGTITGVGREIRKAFPHSEVVAVEPHSSAVLSGKKTGKHSISGIGVGFIPDVLDTECYGRVITVTEEQARQGVMELARNNGIFAGLSSGANYFASMKTAEKLGPGKRTVTIVCDSGDRYPEV